MSIGAAMLAAVLATDGGAALPDGGSYVVLDVNHGAVWLNLPDGGVSDAPTAVRGGAYLDDDALMHAAKEDAFAEGMKKVLPNVDTGTLTAVGAILFAIGVAVGFALGVTVKK